MITAALEMKQRPDLFALNNIIIIIIINMMNICGGRCVRSEVLLILIVFMRSSQLALRHKDEEF